MIIKQLTCRANGCNRRFQKNDSPIMCKWHWNQVPADKRQEVINQAAIYKRNSFTPSYFLAVAEAIECIAQLEDQPVENKYRETYETLVLAKGLRSTA